MEWNPSRLGYAPFTKAVQYRYPLINRLYRLTYFVSGGTQAIVPQLLAAQAVPYSSPNVFGVPGNQLTQQLYPGLPTNQPPAILGAIQPTQLVAVPQPSPAQLRPGVPTGTGSAAMTSSGGGALQPMMYWYPPGAGHVSPAGNAYLVPTCATPAAAPTRGLAQVPDVLTLVDGVYEVRLTPPAFSLTVFHQQLR